MRPFIHSTMFLAAAASVFAQGPLTPPGPPAPTMKSLDQVASHGIPLSTTNTPGDATNHFIINQPGAYYLAGNLAVTEPTAIRINVAGVTIDLNGFQISTSNATPSDGITVRPAAHDCTLTNGSITAFAQGIDTITLTARNLRIRDITVANCTNFGIRAGQGAVLDACRAHDCSGANAAIATGTGATLRDCTATANTTPNAILAASGSTLTNCAASGNTGTNAISVGNGSVLTNCAASTNIVTSAINTGASCSLTNCIADNNTGTNGFNIDFGSSLHNCSSRHNAVTFGFNSTNNCSFSNCTSVDNVGNAATSAGFNVTIGCSFSNCTAGQNGTTVSPTTASTGIGFNVGSNSTVSGCTGDGNTGDNFRATFDCYLSKNNSTIGKIVDAAGIHVLNNFNRIEGNRVTAIGRGIQVDGTDNLIVGNLVTPQGGPATTAYAIAANNNYGPIVLLPAGGAAVNGNSAASSLNDAAGGSHPWANFSY